jgi:bacterioferritin-associated ferredoxin
MYVCLCNGYRDSELREMARQGYTVAEEAYLALGDGPCCGQCVDFAQVILDTAGGAPSEAGGPAGMTVSDACTSDRTAA